MSTPKLSKDEFEQVVVSGQFQVSLDLAAEDDQPRVRIWSRQFVQPRASVMLFRETWFADGSRSYEVGGLDLLANL